MNGIPAQTPVAVTTNGTFTTQRTVQATLATLATEGAELAGPLVLTIGDEVGLRAELSWWESRALYGWRVLVPRTKDQAGAMSDRLAVHGATAEEVPTIAVEPPRSPTQMERAVKGLVDGRYQWVVFTSTNAVRAVWEKFAEFGLDARAFSGVKIACVGTATADKVREFGITPDLVPNETEPAETSSEGLLSIFPPHDDILDPVDRVLLPRADIATETLAAGPARPRLGDRRRHGLPHRARRAAARPDPRGDQDRWVRRGVLHLVVHRAQPRRDRGQAARPHDRRLHRPADRRDRPRVRAAGGRAARRGPGAAPWSTRWPRTPPACAPRAPCPRRARRRPAAAS